MGKLLSSEVFWMILCLINVVMVSHGLRMPKFSWDTVPVFIHMCNATGPFNESTAEHIARFPIVTIEKGQGYNSTIYPYNESYAETKILQACEQIKKINSSIICIFYYNSVLDWEFYYLHQKMLSHKNYWLNDSNNVTVFLTGDKSFPQPPNGMDVFDFTQTIVQNFWVNECLNLTTIEFKNENEINIPIIDGCFIDKAIEETFPSKYHFTQERLNKYKSGHNKVSQLIQTGLNKSNNSIGITNRLVIDGIIATHLENFTGNSYEITTMMKYAQRGILVQAHAGYFTMGTDNRCDDVNNSLSAFLIAAEKYSYYGCSRGWYIEPDWIKWHYQYDQPLGEPSGKAVLNGDIYTRSFSSGTVVTYNVTSETGNIKWGSWEQLNRYKKQNC